MKVLLSTQTRNKKGQLSRTDQTLTADVLRIGRGTDCAMFLPDPRISLHHAAIHLSPDGIASLEAESGIISIDGSFERASRLREGQRVLLGPYEMLVLAPPPDHDLALSIELIDALREGVDEVRGNVRAGLDQTWLSKRLGAWLFLLAILGIFLAWPALKAIEGQQHPEIRKAAMKQTVTADAAWDPGPLASAHATFGRDCGSCHQEPFVQVRNAACEDCHKAIGWHFPLNTRAAKAVHDNVFPGARCASCHRDHKGPNGLIRSDATLCTDCHRDLKSRHQDASVDDIGDFARDHPPFKLSILQPGKRGTEASVRIAQDTKAKENSGLKFPHDKHLDKKGVRGPDGKVALECANCHVPDEAGMRFKPVTMRDHCQSCHSLEFEPKVTDRQAPHGNVANVLSTLNEFYAQAALADTPIDVVVDAGIRRPGERLAEGKRQAALKWATEKADKIARDLFEDRVCFICHQITPLAATDGQAATWKIAPVAITQHWLPKVRFPHNQHNTYPCSDCHNVSTSKLSADIAIPDIKNCRECHGGNERMRDKARGTCETCHGFHTGSHKAGVPAIVPGSAAHKPIGKAAVAPVGSGK